jgi:excisionase family DNA binding protein
MPPRLLTTQEAAEYLRISRATILRWCKAGQLPAVRIGRQWRIDTDQLERLLTGEVAWGSKLDLEM